MSNSIEFIAGNGIEITANDTNKTLTMVNTSALTPEQLRELINGLSGTNKFVTLEEVKQLIAQNGGSSTAPEGFPKLITKSGNFTIPKTGKYKISAVGGGAGGGMGDGGNPGGDTKVSYGSVNLIAEGGTAPGIVSSYGSGALGGKAKIPYDGTRGACSGGDAEYSGENGATFGAAAFENCGGGGGSPFNFATNDIKAIEAFSATGRHEPNPACGYGAGGTGIDGPHYTTPYGNGGGGCSGHLITFTQIITANTKLNIVVGSGGNIKYRELSHDHFSYHTGGGVQGAVLIEWLGNG